LLAAHFLEQLNRGNNTRKQFSPAFTDTLASRRWPGNVRELKNTVERSFIMADELLEADPSLSLTPPGMPVEQPALPAGLHVPLGSRLDEAERSLIEVTL